MYQKELYNKLKKGLILNYLKKLSDNNIDVLLSTTKAVYVLFYSDDIPTKNKIIDIFDSFATMLQEKVDVYICDIVNEKKVASYFKMNTLPAVLFMKDGVVYGNLAGPASKLQYEEILKNALAELIKNQK
jgi:thioredoxin-like negative regulator of GroEL